MRHAAPRCRPPRLGRADFQSGWDLTNEETDREKVNEKFTFSSLLVGKARSDELCGATQILAAGLCVTASASAVSSSCRLEVGRFRFCKNHDSDSLAILRHISEEFEPELELKES